MQAQEVLSIIWVLLIALLPSATLRVLILASLFISGVIIVNTSLLTDFLINLKNLLAGGGL